MNSPIATRRSRGRQGGLDAASRSSSGRSQERRQHARQRPPADRGPAFGFLQKVDSQNLLTFIIDEHPQTIALIVSHLPPAQAADIISGLPTTATLRCPPRGDDGANQSRIIQKVEKGLEHRMSSVMSQQFEAAGGVPTVARSSTSPIGRPTDAARKPRPRGPRSGRRNSPSDVRIRDWRSSRQGHSDGAQERRDLAMGDALKGPATTSSRRCSATCRNGRPTCSKKKWTISAPFKLSAVEQMQQQIVDVVRRLKIPARLRWTPARRKSSLIQ